MIHCRSCKRITLLSFQALCFLSFHQCDTFQENIFRGIIACDNNYKRNATLLATYDSVSKIECAIKCGSVSGCSGINYCATPGVTSCQLLSSLTTALSCSELEAGDGCSYSHKGPCWNGGIYQPENATCLCPYSFAGSYCQRYYIDCVEAYERGYRDPAVTIVQPKPELPPFEIKCRPNEGPVARVIKRNRGGTDTFAGRLWDDYKLGFGTPARNNMWLGLENIRSLITVGGRSYVAKISVTFTGDDTLYIGYLDHFQLASESRNYTINFSGFRSDVHKPLQDAFTEVGSDYDSIIGRHFCTPDQDCGECATKSNSGWWFSRSCAGVNWNLPADGLVWPNGSQMILVDKILVDVLPLI